MTKYASASTILLVGLGFAANTTAEDYDRKDQRAFRRTSSRLA